MRSGATGKRRFNGGDSGGGVVALVVVAVVVQVVVVSGADWGGYMWYRAATGVAFPRRNYDGIDRKRIWKSLPLALRQSALQLARCTTENLLPKT